MACKHPQIALPTPGKTVNGKNRFKFAGKATSWFGPAPVNAKLLPCRQCILCRLERSREWATRLIHEIPFHSDACFLTLTYDEKHVPVDGSLNPSHLTTFFRDLRSRLAYYGKEKIKYFACGEYGEKFQRPHYHIALYGPIGVLSDDDSRVEEELSRSGGRQFSHSDISAVWPYGRHRLSELSFETAAYVARYILKKVSGDDKEAHYGNRHPEFQRQSNGLGKLHVLKWTSDIYPADHCVLPGRGAFMPPAYYDRLLEKADPALYQKVKEAREESRLTPTHSEWMEGVYTSHMKGEVKQLVTESTLIRGGV